MPCLRRPSQHVLWQFIWGNGVPFSLLCPSHQCNYRSKGSFVLQNIVRGGSDDCALLLSACSFFCVASPHFLCFYPSFFTPSHHHLPLLYSFSPPSDWHTPSLSLISLAHIQFSLLIRRLDKNSNKKKRTAGITIDFIYLFFLQSHPTEHW